MVTNGIVVAFCCTSLGFICEVNSKLGLCCTKLLEYTDVWN